MIIFEVQKKRDKEERKISFYKRNTSATPATTLQRTPREKRGKIEDSQKEREEKEERGGGERVGEGRIGCLHSLMAKFVFCYDCTVAKQSCPDVCCALFSEHLAPLKH